MNTPEELKKLLDKSNVVEFEKSFSDRFDDEIICHYKLNNKAVNEVIDTYKINNVQSTWMKKWFYWIVVVVMLLALVGSVVVFVILATRPNTYADIGVGIGALGVFIATVWKLPEIIAKNLFPVNEVTYIKDVFAKSMDELSRKKDD